NSVDGGYTCATSPPYDCTHEAHGTLVPFQGTIPIGAIDPGASAMIRYTIRARVYTGALDPTLMPPDPPRAAGVAWFSDPFGLAQIVLVNGTPLSMLVPEPEPAMGGAAAVAALAVGARRRGRRRLPAGSQRRRSSASGRHRVTLRYDSRDTSRDLPGR